MNLPPPHLLSKTSYLQSLQCEKSLYLYKYHYKKRDPVSPELFQRFQKGHVIGKLAQEKFPGGISCQPEFPSDFRKSIVYTQQLISEKFPVIYEPAFQFKRALVATDLLVLKNNKYTAYEVKSSVEISEVYLKDAAMQYYIILNSGLEIDDFVLIHLNRPVNEALQSKAEIFTETSVKEYCINNLEYTSKMIDNALKIISIRRLPEVKTGFHCIEPYRCLFYQFCHSPELQNRSSDGLTLSLGF
ncbi:MAG: hypothetical protein LC117_02835 [Bacteroidia bacterium]|nr:hypothetical protein [Bacteroidia bacterium]MCZ2276849.1 hypothetical protein [Bacteroidia bacterium]